MTPPDPSHSEVLVVSDSVNKDDNDVTAGDIITLCQPGGQKRALPGLPSCVGSSSRERERAQRLIYPFGFQFNSASLSAYSHIQILPVWGFVRRKTFWFVLPTLYLYYCLEWKHSVTLCRISGDLAPHSKSLTLFKMYCFHKDACAQPLSSLSPPVSSLFPSTSSSLILSFSLSLAYISICPLAPHVPVLLFWLCFLFFLPLWPVPFASITEYNLVPLSRINASVTPNPGEQIERLLVFMSTISYLTLHYLLSCRY